MKKLLLPLLFFAGLVTAEAQSICTPDTTMKEAGMYPNNLPDAKAGVGYKEVIQFKFPKDTSYQGVNVPIDSVKLVKVTGLPAGFTFVCNSNDRCSYKGGDNGCVVVNGNPKTEHIGDYLIEITGEGYARFGGITLPPQEFKRTVSLKVVGNTSFYTVKKNMVNTFEVKQNQPNPFNRSTLIEYISPNAQQVTFKVFDILGHAVYSEDVKAMPGENSIVFERNGLKNGIYFYNIQMGNKLITKKMTIRD
ncbi:MAG: T9SS type A sorting domain-containing protein [Bacteroidia bacterium]